MPPGAVGTEVGGGAILSTCSYYKGEEGNGSFERKKGGSLTQEGKIKLLRLGLGRLSVGCSWLSYAQLTVISLSGPFEDNSPSMRSANCRIRSSKRGTRAKFVDSNDFRLPPLALFPISRSSARDRCVLVCRAYTSESSVSSTL